MVSYLVRRYRESVVLSIPRTFPFWLRFGLAVESSRAGNGRWVQEVLEGKIGGAAQRRFPVGSGGAVLHHVTMAYDIDAAKMSRVLNTSREKMSDKAVKSAVKRVDPMKSQTGLSREHIVEHLIDWFAA